MWNDTKKKISDSKTIFLGDSHGQNGINPDFYSSEKSANFCASGEGYHFCYIKLKSILSKKNSLQKVVLTLSSHNLSKEIDPLWIYNSNNFQEKSATYYPFLTGTDFVRFQKNNLYPISALPDLLNASAKKSIYGIERKILIGEPTFYGGYTPNNKVYSESKEKRKNKSFELSIFQKTYLDSIVKICSENNLKLILVSTPEFNTRGRTRQELTNFIPSGTTYFDYRNLFSSKDCFADPGHLNEKGARLFTRALSKDLKQN